MTKFSQDIVHGDVKCENMLVFEAAGEPREQADSGEKNSLE